MHACAQPPLAEKTQAAATEPRVAILLATYNGERYLAEQLESLLKQTHKNWVLYVSDDGSCDTTLDILGQYQSRLQDRLHIQQGPKQGFAANFLSMAVADKITADYFAFCDQDDLWHADKLERALAWLEHQPPEYPGLYCSRTRLVGSSGAPIGLSPLLCKPPSFRNALVQSIAGGNTMVFNSALKHLVTRAGNPTVVSHDWWLYMLTSGCKGNILYDTKPAIGYRQHGANLIGSNRSLKSRLKRLKNVMSGHYKQWNEINLSALETCKHLLSDDSRRVLERFAHARRATLLVRVFATLRSGVHRQGFLENLALLAAMLFRKV
ncbi:glycosyltransferase family 2 protein [Aquipseudomonas ullengensis]|uniref:Glycosyltransferase family 2 protein n=1 Tax=Aquipseudomonas ullengensis TaxID=2759166 RepID=A0A7W4Q937_9GAMM|nr:glycosyltransferase family 2 protein [Pseudomonas ullengensis]MBB2494402.1 glycosyltransferase family 2 protein [Pseudomonas ullengensis]